MVFCPTQICFPNCGRACVVQPLQLQSLYEKSRVMPCTRNEILTLGRLRASLCVPFLISFDSYQTRTVVQKNKRICLRISIYEARVHEFFSLVFSFYQAISRVKSSELKTVSGRVEEIQTAEAVCSPENADTEESYMER